jgi:hypothetical protein
MIGTYTNRQNGQRVHIVTVAGGMVYFHPHHGSPNVLTQEQFLTQYAKG